MRGIVLGFGSGTSFHPFQSPQTSYPMSTPLVDFNANVVLSSQKDEQMSGPQMMAQIRNAGFDTACLFVEGEEKDLVAIPSLAKSGLLVGLSKSFLHLYEDYEKNVAFVYYIIGALNQLDDLPAFFAKVVDLNSPILICIRPKINIYSANDSALSATEGLQGRRWYARTPYNICSEFFSRKV